jgi:hypothetical protein
MAYFFAGALNMKKKTKIEDRTFLCWMTEPSYTFGQLKEDMTVEKIAKTRDWRHKFGKTSQVISYSLMALEGLAVAVPALLYSCHVIKTPWPLGKYTAEALLIPPLEAAYFFGLGCWSKKVARNLDQAVVVIEDDPSQARFGDTIKELVEQGYYDAAAYPAAKILERPVHS